MRSETHDVYSDCHRLKSADELVKRLQVQIGRLKNEVQDFGNKRLQQKRANNNGGGGRG